MKLEHLSEAKRIKIPSSLEEIENSTPQLMKLMKGQIGEEGLSDLVLKFILENKKINQKIINRASRKLHEEYVERISHIPMSDVIELVSEEIPHIIFKELEDNLHASVEELIKYNTGGFLKFKKAIFLETLRILQKELQNDIEMIDEFIGGKLL